MQLARGVLWLSALTFAGFGLAFIAMPRPMASAVEIQIPTPTARIDFMATYGGLELGVAVFLALCLRRDDRVSVGLLASGLSLLGLGVTRAAGIVFATGPVRPILFLLLAAEVCGAALSFWAARRAASPRA